MLDNLCKNLNLIRAGCTQSETFWLATFQRVVGDTLTMYTDGECCTLVSRRHKAQLTTKDNRRLVNIANRNVARQFPAHARSSFSAFSIITHSQCASSVVNNAFSKFFFNKLVIKFFCKTIFFKKKIFDVISY